MMERVSSARPRGRAADHRCSRDRRWEASLSHHIKNWTLALAALGLLAGCGTNGSPGVFHAPGNSGLQGFGDVASQFGSDGANDFAPLTDAGATTGEAPDGQQGTKTGGADGAGGAPGATDADNGVPNGNVDADKDGFTIAGGDCNDGDPKINPKAIEVCDKIDNNCSGDIDDVDVDKDGWPGCPGTDYDCNDHDEKVYPGAPLNCANGLDNDCNGIKDDQENLDKDGDGFSACKDCDDNDKLIFPGAKQNCLNKKDNDCDGVVDTGFDADKDGFSACPGPNQDCDDSNPKIHPGAPELCDKIDNDCNENIDDNDMDGDGYYGCENDCDDNDINVNPGAGRVCDNGKDNDCSGVIDAKEDGDGDGFAGCADCNDYDPDVNPNEFDPPGDMIDNDCDGQTDEVPPPCDVPGLATGNPLNYAKAFDLCIGMKKSQLVKAASSKSHAIRQSYGSKIKPQAKPNLVVISSGVAAAIGQPGYKKPQSGTAFSNSAAYPKVKCKKSGSVYDYTEWKLTIKVPGGASAFSFQFNFMSSEYPEWVNSKYDDKFLAVMDSKKFKGNVSFDSKGKCISINSAFFTVCKGCKYGDSQLAGTGYGGGIGGGTGWLKTTVPVTSGETITLRFIVFDEGDHILDSVVLLDDFQWEQGAAKGGPSTVRPGG